jgi:hypothetical protein
MFAPFRRSVWSAGRLSPAAADTKREQVRGQIGLGLVAVSLKVRSMDREQPPLRVDLAVLRVQRARPSILSRILRDGGKAEAG